MVYLCAEPCDFRCGDGQCLPRNRVCDRVLDCTDHSDAQNCSSGLEGVVYLQPSDLPLQCPNSDDFPAVCDAPACRAGQCGAGQLCCSSGCGSLTCTTGVPTQPLCRSISRQVGLIGAFRPSCERDGSFSEVQCHGSVMGYGGGQIVHTVPKTAVKL